MFQEVYNLKNDIAQIRLIQEASILNNPKIGLKKENGLLYGSNEWFRAIDIGEIKKYTISGFISRKYKSGHNDYPEIEVTDMDGVKTMWEIKGNEALYIAGCKIKIAYIHQKFKMGKITNCIIKVSIDINS